jgi:type I restriction enzyme S subunit
MSSEWPISELGKEAFNASRPFSFKTHPQVVFVNTGDVLHGKFLHAHISEGALLPGQAKKALKQNDILLTEIRPGNGRYAFVDFPVDRYVVSTKFMVIESRGRVIPKFLYHVLTNQSALDEFQRIAESRSGTFPQITFDSIEHFPVPVPPPSVQDELVKFFDALDDRITLLRETNTTLEAIAQALFKSWFVDFDPVHAKMQGSSPEGMDEATAALFPDSFEESELGSMPKGWRIGTLADLASFQNGYAFKSKDWSEAGHPVIKIGNVKPSLISFEGCSFVGAESVTGLDRFKLKRGDLLVGMTGYVGETGLVTKVSPAAYLNQRVGRIATSAGVRDLGFVFCSTRHEDYKAFAEGQSHGSAQANVSGSDLLKFKSTIPDNKVIRAFNEVMETLIESIMSNHEQAQMLGELRDTLLPKLVSGELPVSHLTVECEA